MSTHPPYTSDGHFLSDTIVGNVFQYTRPPNSSYVESEKTINALASPMASPSRQSKKIATSQKLRKECVAKPKTATRYRHDEAFSSIGDQTLLAVNVVDLTKDSEMITSLPPRPRERSHMSHRKKQEQLMKDLKEYNWNLQREVWSLEFRRNETLLSIPTEQTVWTIALEYFRIFRYGLNDTMETNYPYTWKFLSTAMTTDVTYESVCGHEAILNYWRLFSHYFDDIFVELECLTKGNEANTLLATTIMSVTISKNTLRRVFPHLIREERSRLGLAAKLIDQQVVMRRLVLFKWNDKLKCVERIHSQADMLTPMLQIVGSLENVSRVFENALVTAECKLIPEISGDSRYWMQLMR